MRGCADSLLKCGVWRLREAIVKLSGGRVGPAWAKEFCGVGHIVTSCMQCDSDKIDSSSII